MVGRRRSPVNLTRDVRHLHLRDRLAAEGERLHVLRTQDRSKSATTERTVFGGHDGGEPDAVLARRADTGDVVLVEAV